MEVSAEVGDLDGKVALLTAGGGAIASATALKLAQAGASIACADVDLAAAERTASTVRAAGGRALAVKVDALDLAECERAVADVIAALGGLHVLCNLVGYFGPRGAGSLDTIDLERWEWMLDINLTSVFCMSRAAIPAILASGGGAIVNTGTLAAVIARGGIAYGTTKSAVLGLTRAMASDYQPLGIRVNCVCPSATDSPMYWSAGGQNQPRREDVVRSVQGLATPEEIAEVFLFLASNRSARVTGHILMADNGFSTLR
jgi:NAD(P)-dependent dehydrogenase (short-subunit alcohol dehydrogenase family)